MFKLIYKVIYKWLSRDLTKQLDNSRSTKSDQLNRDLTDRNDELVKFQNYYGETPYLS